MDKIKKLFKKYKMQIKYLIFGVLTTLVSYISFYILLNLLGQEGALFSNLVSFILATLFAFFTNKFIVFERKNKDHIFKELIKFFSSRIFSFGIEELGLFIATKVFSPDTIWFGLNYLFVVKILMSFIVVILNYIMSKYLVFKD